MLPVHGIQGDLGRHRPEEGDRQHDRLIGGHPEPGTFDVMTGRPSEANGIQFPMIVIPGSVSFVSDRITVGSSLPRRFPMTAE